MDKTGHERGITAAIALMQTSSDSSKCAYIVIFKLLQRMHTGLGNCSLDQLQQAWLLL